MCGIADDDSRFLLRCFLMQILLGGGQDASSVTTTSSKAGGFEARFFHKVGPGWGGGLLSGDQGVKGDQM